MTWLKQHNPRYLLSYPSCLQVLAQRFIETSEDLPNLREVRTFGEIVEPGIRRICKDAWNVPVVDVYSTQEVGYIALQCPDYEHYHVQAENLLVEVLDEQNNPCSAGETGRVVLTTLNNFAMPLIRYDLEDYAEVGPPCPCGRGLPVLKRILGRQRNILVYPNGDKKWPSFGQGEGLEELPPLNQFQVIQRTLNHLEVKVVRLIPITPAEEEQARKYLQDTLEYPFRITFTQVDEIPRSPSGKFEDFRSELDPSPQTS